MRHSYMVRNLGTLRQFGYRKQRIHRGSSYDKYTNRNGDQILLNRSGSQVLHYNLREGVNSFNSPTRYKRFDARMHTGTPKRGSR